MKGKADCPICHGEGEKEGSWGIKITCNCVLELLNEADKQEESTLDDNEKEFLMYSDDINVYLQEALYNGVLTKEDIELEYNREYALKNLAERCSALHRRLSKYTVQQCLDVMDSILATVRMGKLPTKSYAFGVENGVGKTTFAQTAIKYAAMQQFNVVPLIDMTTLAEKYIEYSNKLKKSYEDAKRNVIDDNSLDFKHKKKVFTWSDYVSADFVVVMLTDGGNSNIAYIELDTLLTLLTKRSINKKPTIVLMRTPVEYYTKFEEVRKYLVKELFALKNTPGSYHLLENYSMFTREPD